MTYDAATGDVVLFGGYGKNFERLDDTWTWNGRSWKELHPRKSPSPRTGAEIAYDPNQRDVVLFGGYGKTHDDDTWTWNGKTWAKVHPATHPPADVGGVMVYDPAVKNVVLSTGLLPGSLQGKTWIWNGHTWVQIENVGVQPTGFTFSMAYDQATHHVLRVGGGTSETTAKCSGPATTLTWTNGVWTLTSPAATAPPGWGSADLAYDVAAGQMIFFGGTCADALSSSTWDWNGTSWTELSSPQSPSGRQDASMAYDARTKDLVLFGGREAHEVFDGDTWTWNGATWTRRS